MTEGKQIEGLLEMCRDLQEMVHLSEFNGDENSVRFSCDLLLRNMIMLLELNQQGKDLNNELGYLKDNLLGVYCHITTQKFNRAMDKYNLTY